MKRIAFFILILSIMAGCGGVRRSGNNVIVNAENGEKVRIEVISGNMVRVSAAPEGAGFSSRKSLAVLENPGKQCDFILEKSDSVAVITTSSLTVNVSRATGKVTFNDLDGNAMLEEDRREFSKIEVDGDKGYSVRQVFMSPADEAFYGLGQHQSDEFNYKGKNEILYQYNTKVSVPFIVSTKGYGLLWDNCSLTRWGDPRDYAQLDEAFAVPGLKATYRASDGTVIERTESRLDYSDLDKVNEFPEGFMDRFYGSTITWEGDIVPEEDGIYRFILYYAGYTTVFVDGEEIVPEHWRTAWNPNSVKFQLDMEAGKPRHLKVLWRPDGGVSYLSLKALTPVPAMEQEKQSWWSEMGDQVDYYFIAGANADKVISGYRQLTGKSQIMPKWAMGYWQSRERYKTQDELLGALAENRRRGIGIDNIVMDWSYWEEDAWGSHEFDPVRFPDPKAMIDSVHAMNANIMISVWPKFYASTEHYRELDAIGAMYRRAVQDSVRDWIGPGYIGSFYDAYNPKARELFWEQMSGHLFSKGIDAWWMDASEPDILSNASLEYRKALSTPTYLGSSTRYLNAYALMNAEAIYEGQRGESPDQRVFLLTRSGFAGLQRYSTATWSGDIGTCWEDMKAQISAGLNFAMSGIPYWTQDIGGFCVQKKFETAVEGTPEMEEWRELNARWHQWGAFCPLYRSHGQYPYREIYNIAPESHPAYRSMIYYNKLRYRLMPYIYTMAAGTWFNDGTIMRPLAMDFPDDPDVREIGDQFMFGSAIMVCPVYEYGARSRDVYFPEGLWYDMRTGECVEGGCRRAVQAPYEYTPVYVRAGSIVPMGPEIEYTSQEQDGSLTLEVYAGADASFELYEDEGVNYNYEKGIFSTIRFDWDDSGCSLVAGERNGSFPGMFKEREIFVRVHDTTGETTGYSFRYDGKERVCQIGSQN
ncbi:MAG: DUF5110 domain-containing protein [Bacteroidales bacterium]|nr:DUF5110 domain-containing protein [Bacteroidales bacterium]